MALAVVDVGDAGPSRLRGPILNGIGWTPAVCIQSRFIRGKLLQSEPPLFLSLFSFAWS